MQPGSGRVTANVGRVPAVPDGPSTVHAALVDSISDVGTPLREAWRTARSSEPVDPPELASYLPDSDATRRRWLVQLISVDLQERWLHSGLPKRLREYCAEFDDLDRSTLPVGLIYEEFCIRRQSGDSVSPQDYVAEYPAQANELADLLNTTADEKTEFHDAAPGVDSTRASPAPLESTATFAADGTGTASADLEWTKPGSRDELEDLDVGDRLDDFDLLMGLGRGAFARVFLARQRSMQRIVAVKISENRGSEPQTLAQLDHDYIVRVFDQRVLPAQGLRLLYMQYLPGGTLLGVLARSKQIPAAERSGRSLLDAVDASLEDKGGLRPTDSTVRQHLCTLSWPETVAWLGRRLAEALHYAGERGVLHRDIKPANVLLTAEGVPKLADFNISFSDHVKGDSPVAYFGGSLSYMSPEQLEACHPGKPGRAEDLDTRSDLYSLGVLLWELLTGSKPFEDTDVGAEAGDRTTIDGLLGARRAGVGEDALAALPADCPATLRRVLLKCLAASPEDRWSTGQELAQQFDLCLDARARDLVDPPPTSPRLRLRPYTVPVAAAAIGIPNLIAAVYNYKHNKALIISDLLPVAQERFETVSTIINGLVWPIGLILIVYFCRRVLTVPRALRAGREVPEKQLAHTRADTLLVADRAVAVCLGLWIAAGVAFPVSLQIAAGSVPAQAYVHFIASLVVCGAMATAYPFFLVSLFTIRSIYPSFLPYGRADDGDRRRLLALYRRSVVYLTIAASIPLVGVAGLTFVPAVNIPDIIDVVRVVCVGGIFAFVASYYIFRLLEGDLQALLRVVSTPS
ncbi:serine/threonine-protein kinase [Rhodococcoides yunnanense]|uniref:serine/threonine-protein kinase n=1 Tax=Rhodococcoides yunnanense TaxID=278209 RepID=UPI001FE7EA0C|nr:serine/threonine-protein kinase [Rhodococcus yunnanensis]